MKGIYTGDEFPEYKGAETITFNNKTYINGLDYQTVKSGKHVRIEECPICNRLSIIYARGVCKACAQRTLYRHRRDKTGDVMTERNIREANIAFRKGWPVNIICGLDGVRYNIDAILAIRDTTVTDYLLKHYKDGIKYSDMAYAENKSKQNAHGFGRRRLAYVRNILRTKGLLKGPKTTK